jgi:predicted LPLAT superfamily acyltransferase
MKPNLNNSTKKVRQPWSSRSIGPRIGHHIFYLLIRIGGRPLAYFILYFVTLYYFLFRPSQRQKAYPYLSHRFPDQTLFSKFGRSYLLMLNLGQVLIDRAIAGILGPEHINVTFNGKKELLDLVHKKQGFILMMSHVGCWQVALATLNFLKVPVHLLLEREAHDVDKHYFEHRPNERIFHIIDPRGYLGGTIEMMGALKSGDILSVMGDRVAGSEKNIIKTDFINKPAPFPYSAYKIASATGAPILVLFSYKTGRNQYTLELAHRIDVPSDLGRTHEAFYPYVTQYAQTLEHYTHAHPYQFFNFYDMWQEP